MNIEDESVSCVLFRLRYNSDIFAIPIQYVTWIEALEGKIVPIPQSPGHAVGVCQLHGKSVSVIDLGGLLGFRPEFASVASKQHLILLANTQTGFLVDTILGIEMLQSRQDAGNLSSPFAHSVYSCAQLDGMILELDVPSILAHANAQTL